MNAEYRFDDFLSEREPEPKFVSARSVIEALRREQKDKITLTRGTDGSRVDQSTAPKGKALSQKAELT